VIVLDLDKFKDVNDTHGHQKGDEILKRTASNMKRRTRATDYVGRWGGEEFVIILPHTDEAAGASVAEQIRDLIEQSGDVTASLGIVEVSPKDLIKYPLSDMVARADIALYEAKDRGRNQVVRLSEIVPIEAK
jgi:diguanylate cyclase (GGDEF)-like protein